MELAYGRKSAKNDHFSPRTRTSFLGMEGGLIYGEMFGAEWRLCAIVSPTFSI